MKKIALIVCVILMFAVGMAVGTGVRLYPTKPMPPKDLWVMVMTQLGPMSAYVPAESMTEDTYCTTWMWEGDEDYCVAKNASGEDNTAPQPD